MVQLGVCEFPLKYVLRRWTWSAQENLVEELPGQPTVMPEESRKKMWLSVNCNEFKGLAMCGNEIEDGRKIIRMHMKAMKKDLAPLKRETEKRAKKVATSSATYPAENPSTQTAQANCPTQQVPPQVPSTGPRARKPPCQKRKSTGSSTSAANNSTATAHNGGFTDAEPSETSQANNIRDPRVSNTKGRKRKKAFQKPLDIGRKEIRVCKQCGSTQHDFRTCPQRGELADEN
jgi:hypothetical protein